MKPADRLRSELIEKYREAHRLYHDLVPERALKFKEFDEAVGVLHHYSAQIAKFNAQFKDLHIHVREAVPQ